MTQCSYLCIARCGSGSCGISLNQMTESKMKGKRYILMLFIPLMMLFQDMYLPHHHHEGRICTMEGTQESVPEGEPCDEFNCVTHESYIRLSSNLMPDAAVSEIYGHLDAPLRDVMFTAAVPWDEEVPERTSDIFIGLRAPPTCSAS